MPPEQRRASIVEATLPLLQLQGVSISTRQIAEAAGVAEGTLFRVFDSLSDILEATITEYLSVERLRAYLADIDAGDSLESVTRATIQLMIDDYRNARAVFATAHFHPHDAKSSALRENIRERVTVLHGWAEEQFRSYTDQLRVTPEQYSHFVITLAHGYGNRLSEPYTITVDDLTRLALHGGLSKESS